MPLTILVVDENAAALTTIVAALARAGYRALGAQSFPEAAQTIARVNPSLLIANVRLGQYNGLHLLVRGRVEHPELAVIMIGPDNDMVAAEAQMLGARAYLRQPLDLATLLMCVPDVVEQIADAPRPIAPVSASPVACAPA